ncbi:MAG: gliding motility-associated C-terminal domain-containing protein [Ferruginibacter sp.]
MKKIFLFSLLFTVLGFRSMSQQLAFPGAEGYGKYAAGGRGGQVAEVTNLNDTGNGSLRWALDQYVDTVYVYKDAANPNFPVTTYQPLTVVFKVSGTIHLRSELRIKRDNLTIAGQTAPCDGICITGNSVLLNGATGAQLFYFGPRRKNVILRYIRFRPGVPLDNAGNPTMAYVTYGLDVENYENVIVDHCSISWANEECLAIYDTKNTTVQWCIVNEGLYNAYHAKGLRGYGGVWGGQFATYHHNLIANQNNRTPRFNGSRAHDTIALVDYRNNVNYNWASSSAPYGGDVEINGGIARLNLVNNYYKPGPSTPSTHKLMRPDYSGNATGVGRFHVAGNIIDGNAARTADNWLAVDFANIPPASVDSSRSDTAFTIAQPIEMSTAQAAYDTVLQWAGAVLPKRDPVDTRIINEVKTKTAAGRGSAGKPGIIDAPEAVGGVPVYEACTMPIDTDHDGMPDDWEKENDLDPGNASDRNTVNSNGYTKLEQYLNSLALGKVAAKVCPSGESFLVVSDVKGATYQWEENNGNGFAVLNGQTDSVLSLQLNLNAAGFQYRCRVNENSYSKIYTARFETSWTGAVDSLWENAANWSCNEIPGINTDVYIGTGKATLNSSTAVRSLTMGKGASLVAKPGYNLTLLNAPCSGLENDDISSSDNGRLFVVNAFTPNMDGLNERFKVFGIDIETVDITVYNSDNTIVFHATALNTSWAPAVIPQNTFGGYKYRVQAVTKNGNKIGVCGDLYIVSCLPPGFDRNRFHFEDQLTQDGFTLATSDILSNCR